MTLAPGGEIQEIMEEVQGRVPTSTKREGLDSILGGSVVSSEAAFKPAFKPVFYACARVKKPKRIGNMWQVIERVG